MDFNQFLKKMKSLSVSDRGQGWICSLNHGVLPKTPEINVRYFIQAIREQLSNGNSLKGFEPNYQENWNTNY